MKAFDIRLDRRDTFVVYYDNEDNKIILLTDKENPCPCTTSLWDKDTNTFSKHQPPHYNRLLFPTYAIPKEDINDFWTIHIPELINYGSKYDPDCLINNNIVILTKEWDNVFEVGFGLKAVEYPIIHTFAQRVVDQYLGLKAFW